jgi:hypothetical protein
VPSVITTIRQGDAILIGPERVISTPRGWPLLGRKILVSQRSHEQDLRRHWVYREEQDNDVAVAVPLIDRSRALPAAC